MMSRNSVRMLAVAVSAFVTTAAAEVTAQSVTMTSPAAGTALRWRAEVGGRVSESNTTLWVVVHPLNVSEYWVQPSVLANDDGTWSTIAYIGRRGDADIGREYEVVVFADPSEPIQEGLLDRWPRARWHSKPVRVTRVGVD